MTETRPRKKTGPAASQRAKPGRKTIRKKDVKRRHPKKQGLPGRIGPATSPLAAAQVYLDDGMQPIQIPFKEKAPNHKG